MELPPFELDVFNKWKGGQAVIKECAMDEEMRVDAKEHVSSGIEKFQSAEGVDYKSAGKYIKDNKEK